MRNSNVLVLGGTGLISAGVVKHLSALGAKVTVFNRNVSPRAPAGAVEYLVGDRTDRSAFEHTFAKSRFDVVIDMICFSPEDAESTIAAFGGRCGQLQFCSTVCTYGVKIPRTVLIDETFPQEPISRYGMNKVQCERRFARAAEEGLFELTILRPSHTYGPGFPLIDQMEADSATWDRVARGLPVLCAGDGLGLWQPTHRDDCGRLFAEAAGNPRAYGNAYNATGEEILTWREYYRTAARALGGRARLVFVPATWLLRRRPQRFGFLAEITRFHGAYSSAKARADFPGFRPSIDFETGARETFDDLRRRGAFRDSTLDTDYQQLIDEALSAGFDIEDA